MILNEGKQEDLARGFGRPKILRSGMTKKRDATC